MPNRASHNFMWSGSANVTRDVESSRDAGRDISAMSEGLCQAVIRL